MLTESSFFLSFLLQLKSDGNYQFQLNFLFLYPGLYNFNITCRESVPLEGDDNDIGPQIHVSSNTPRYSRSSLPIIVQEDSIVEKRETKVWKYRPAVKVLVKE